ncbi:type III-A CRISPR-associated RAMP protein Csm5 [Methylococcus sp. Mc7]|uniref:type III-A CRISPR-associated RAMP protein Csm5 n=1 Tax=Methylococcus sp. Mc7 TaxID=2860258 RepID=UPI001C533DB4|nr:type III-A CRISPR-associated RAMP protein Csm5 [Methylococcus sp. Mc7]QXP83826.1 type III-A CRISPR-associated RAMP protein Csm5 [Methylococcus sp. Mc7]
MRNMKGKTESVQLGLEVLTPVQAGSGANLSKNLDYIDHAGKVFVVDQERTFEAIAAGEAALDSVLSGSKLDDLVKLAGQRFGYALPPLSGQGALPDQFREHLKDAFLNPYIPGTALKGAIRTVLFATALRNFPETSYQSDLPHGDARNNKPSTSAKMAAKKLADNLFGKDPNNDLFRALHVGDALFKTEDFRLADIRWMNLVKVGGKEEGRWRRISIFDPKDEKPFKNQKEWKDASGIYAETLAPQALAPVTLQWDGFLLSDLNWHCEHPLPNLLPKSFDELRARLNEHAQRRLQDEIAFYQHYGQSEPQGECERLLGLIKSEPSAAYLQLSWGSGWKGMTGDWMGDGIKEAMRGFYREMRGRDGMPFPKTRRLVVANNHPCLPLGWIRLLKWEDCVELDTFRARSQRDQTPAEQLRKEEARRRADARAAREAADREKRLAALSANARRAEDLEAKMTAGNKGSGKGNQLFQLTNELIKSAGDWPADDQQVLRAAAMAIFEHLGLKKEDYKKLVRHLAPP